MGDFSNFPKFNEVAAYVDKYAPQVRQSIEQLGGDANEVLRVGLSGGDDEQDHADLLAGLVLRAKALDLALADAIISSQIDLNSVITRLSRLKRVRFAALVAGAVGSSTVLATALSEPIAAVVAGVLALIASICGLAAENLIIGQRNSEDTLREIAATFVRVTSQGALTQRMLSLLIANPSNGEELRTTISEGNALFGELMAARANLIKIS